MSDEVKSKMNEEISRRLVEFWLGEEQDPEGPFGHMRTHIDALIEHLKKNDALNLMNEWETFIGEIQMIDSQVQRFVSNLGLNMALSPEFGEEMQTAMAKKAEQMNLPEGIRDLINKVFPGAKVNVIDLSEDDDMPGQYL